MKILSLRKIFILWSFLEYFETKIVSGAARRVACRRAESQLQPPYILLPKRTKKSAFRPNAHWFQIENFETFGPI